MKIAIATGGGGHFSPALAVMESLPKDWKVILIGRKNTFEGDRGLSLEYQIAKNRNLPFEPLTTGRLQRRFTRHSLLSFIKIPYGFFQALLILKKHKPDLVLSFGGYVSVPVVVAAYLLRLPIVIHEQTLQAGLANKIAAKFADKICISWEESRKFFPQKNIVLTGNPLRHEFIKSGKEKVKIGKSSPVIYVTGGSAGAHAVNTVIEGSLDKLLKRFILIHQTGDAKAFNDFDRLFEKRENMGVETKKRFFLMKFIDPDKVVNFLEQADLVISRAGMGTITELLYLGKPTLFIPLPFGQKNEQLENALFVKNLGMAEVIEQQLLTPQSLVLMISNMMHNLAEYKRHGEKAKKLIHTDAAKKIIEVITDVYQSKKI